MKIALLVFMTVLEVWAITQLLHQPKIYKTSIDGAKNALSQIQEWAKWISGIQTLTIAGLAWFHSKKNGDSIAICGELQYYLAALAFVCIGIALYCSAWIMASVPSQSIRIHTRDPLGKAEHFDVYEQALLGEKGPTLGYVLTLNHWYWGVGLFSFGLSVLIFLLG